MKIAIVTISILSFFVFNSPSSFRIEESKRIINTDSSVTISISVVGDLMCHSPQFEYARVAQDSFDFNPVYRNVKKYLESSDFTFGNLETVTAGKENGGYTGYPLFNTPASYISSLKEVGFDLLVTANNHSLDRGEKGILRTIEEINSRNLHYIGTYTSQADRDSIRVFDVKGIKIAILAYSYGTNGNPIPKGKSYLINLIDYNLIEKDIQSAKINGAELVLVHFHFGEEYKREPVQFQKDVVDKTIELGADIIIGGHPHVLQPVNFYKSNNAKLDSGFVAYSMGNFFSNQRDRFKDAGMILTIKITKDIMKDKIDINSVNYLPTWVFKGNTTNGKEYVIIPSTNISDTTISLSKSDLSKMTQAFDDTRFIINKYTMNPKLREIRD
ncbi:MAG: CapA family protein [Ignavibacterium sp.]|jgi:poly-gamma-glutamate synthesis protein (capsule biosynthesis protein)|nr:CapA family protein [Ignavibacterium sp.]